VDGDRAPRPVDAETHLLIERFLADEAALLDRQAYAEWFALLTDDVAYRITTRVHRDREDGIVEHAIVDEDHDNLKMRVDQLANPNLTRAENPPSLYRRFVANLRADLDDRPDSFAVRTNLLVYKNRPSNADVELYAAERHDLIRRTDAGLRIAARLVRLDQSVLVGGTLSTLL